MAKVPIAVDLVKSGDWLALYLNGKQAMKGENLDIFDVLSVLVFKCKLNMEIDWVELDNSWAEKRGFPTTLNKKALIKKQTGK